MATLTVEQMRDYGVTVSGVIKMNGEQRFSLMVGDVSSTWFKQPAGENSVWHNAHYHEGIIETYVVQTGKIAMAFHDSVAGNSVHVYGPGRVVSTVPNEAHSVYFFPDSEILIVMHGTAVGNPEKDGTDWYPADTAFDAWSKGLTEADIEREASKEG